jgi:hypothetical protein
MKPTMPVNEKPKSLPRRFRWRTLFKLAILGVVIATMIPVLHLAIPALAYRDDLLALLNYSDDCHAPCFMGITPGVTTREEALKILDQDTRIIADFDSNRIYLKSYSDTPIPPNAYIYGVSFENNILSQIELRSLPFVTVVGLLGLPEYMTEYGAFVYPESGIMFHAPCAENMLDALSRLVAVSFTAYEDYELMPVNELYYRCPGVFVYPLF